MRYLVCETIKCYHMVEIDDEVDIEDVVNECNYHKDEYDNAIDSISETLTELNRAHGFEYEIKPDFGGTEIVSIDVIEELD